MNYYKHMNVYEIFDSMLEDVKSIKRTTSIKKFDK